MRQVMLKDGRKAIVTDDIHSFNVGYDERGNPITKRVKHKTHVMASIGGHAFQPLNRDKIKKKDKE